MKITFVMAGGFNLTGGERVIATYAKHLQQRGHEVFAVSCPIPPPSFREQLRSLRQGKGWISSPPKEGSHIRQANIPHRLLDSTRPIVDADVPDADVVVATWWETAEWVANLSPAKGAKAYFMQDYGAPGQELEQIVPTWTLPLHIITIAQWLGDLITKHCGHIPLTVVPNAVDLDMFYAEPRGKQTRPTVGLMYRSMPSKGADLALKAIELAGQAIPDLQVIAFGLEDLTQLPPNTTYLQQPPDSELRKIYATCDAWLFPSRREGFGLPILEAMACRTPVIATPAGAAPEILAKGGGILVQPENPVDIASAIQTISQLSAADWQAMSDLAYQNATGYTWEDATDRFEAGLHLAIERSKRGDFAKTVGFIT